MILKAVVKKFVRSIKDIPKLDQFIQSKPYNVPIARSDKPVKFYLESYGCQMNQADSQIILTQLKARHKQVQSPQEAEIVLINTCAIRQNAQNRVITRIRQLKKQSKVGILGCMAQRMKKQLKQQGACLVVGPDQYRQIANLVDYSFDLQFTIQTMLSQQQTYGDIDPTPLHSDSKQSFVSIMRGCNNMCSFCIVPFVRGRQRSLDPSSIIRQVQKDVLRGVKQITLLGQNVNSYFYQGIGQTQHENSKGFKQLYNLRGGKGTRFNDLLKQLAVKFPQTRFKFTSPHPKDFPLSVLETIAKYPNIVKNIHLPAQSGSTQVLKRMRRNHTREVYIELVNRIRQVIPNVTISSDFIVGFCGQTQEQFQQSLSLMRKVKYQQAFMFAYSLRPKTHAYHRLQDNVLPQIKQQRLQKLIQCFRQIQSQINKNQISKEHLVLVLDQSKKNPLQWKGLTSTNKKAFFPKLTQNGQNIQPGDYIHFKVQNYGPRSLHGKALARTSIKDFYNLNQNQNKI